MGWNKEEKQEGYYMVLLVVDTEKASWTNAPQVKHRFCLCGFLKPLVETGGLC